MDTATGNVSGNRESSRTRIMEVSRELFSRYSFSQVSLRDIATAAGVSPALIIKHFQSKENLFEQTVDFTASSTNLFMGPFENLGRTMVEETLNAPSTAPYSIIRMLIVTSGEEESLQAIGQRIKDDHLAVLHRRIAAESPHPNPSPALRAQSVVSIITGLSLMRRFGDPDFDTHNREELADHYASVIQRVLDGTD